MLKRHIKSALVVSLLLCFVLFPFVVNAHADPMPVDWGSLSGTPDTVLEEWAVTIYNLIYPVAIGFGVVGIILAGYTYLTSTGDPAKVKSANEKLTSAITGIIFIVLSLVILKVIMRLLLGIRT